MRFVVPVVTLTLLCLGFIFTGPTGAKARWPSPDHKIFVATALKGRFQRTIQAGDLPISIGGFRFRIVRIALDATAMGFVPRDMGPNDRLMFVEFELLSGNRDDFKGLVITLGSGSGKRSKAVVLASGGMMKALSVMTIKSVSSRYRPENANIAWAYVVQEGETNFFLNFPTGDVIRLAPLIKQNCAERLRTLAQKSSVQCAFPD